MYMYRLVLQTDSDDNTLQFTSLSSELIDINQVKHAIIITVTYNVCYMYILLSISPL